MEKYNMTIFNSSILWLGAGISLAELLAGTAIAPLGFSRGLLAILVGHLIGCSALFGAGLIGAQKRKCAMDTVKDSFGNRGALLFTLFNILQLGGWTAIMVYDGAAAADTLLHLGTWLWALLIGLLLFIWLMLDLQHINKLNLVAATGLLLLCLYLCEHIFADRGQLELSVAGTLSFGAAVELSAAMPISWLPLISDYTSKAEKPIRATLASVIVYGLISSFMYMIGMGSVLFTGVSNINSIIWQTGLGFGGLLIILFSTVTTTFLDAYSAGISCHSITHKCRPKLFACMILLAGTVGAIFFPMDSITDFLYLIGSIFTPMTAVLLSDYFLLPHLPTKYKIASTNTTQVNWKNMLIWASGFLLYRFLLPINTPLGETIPDLLLTILLYLFLHYCLYFLQKGASYAKIKPE